MVWDEIDEIREKVWMQRLTIVARAGRSKINLEYQLDGFDRLRQTVLERTKASRERRTQALLEFRKERRTFDIIVAVVALSCGGLALVCWRDNQSLMACFFIVLALAAPMVAITAVPTRLNLTPLGIVVTYPLKQEGDLLL